MQGFGQHEPLVRPVLHVGSSQKARFALRNIVYTSANNPMFGPKQRVPGRVRGINVPARYGSSSGAIEIAATPLSFAKARPAKKGRPALTCGPAQQCTETDAIALMPFADAAGPTTPDRPPRARPSPSVPGRQPARCCC